LDEACATQPNPAGCKSLYPLARSVAYRQTLENNALVTKILYATPHYIAFETDFVTIDPDELAASDGRSQCVVNEDVLPLGTSINEARVLAFVRCNTPSMNVDGRSRVWAPIHAAEVEIVNFNVYRGTRTNCAGYFEIPYRARINEYETFDVNAVVTFGGFEPRVRSAKKFFLTASAVGGYHFQPGQTFMSALPFTNYMTDPAGSSGTAFANMPLDAAILTVNLSVGNSFKDAPPAEGQPAAEHFEPIQATGYWPSVTRYNHEKDRDQIGLLKEINTPDLRDTEIYVYRVADGKLIGSRWGMTDTEVATTDSGVAYLVATMLMRGPASQFASLSENRFNAAANVPPIKDRSGNVVTGGRFGVELDYDVGLTGGRPPFLRVGDQAKVIAINRATGYIGTALVRLEQMPAGTMQFVSSSGSSRIELQLAPPNLKVIAKRTTDVKQGATKGPKTYVIGFEGSGLADDKVIEIQTEWLDKDGSPLPEDLQGFTGRLAMTADTKTPTAQTIELPDGGMIDMVSRGVRPDAGVNDNTTNFTGEDRTGYFPVKPGRGLAVIRLPEGTLDTNHFYVHVAAQPLERNVDFSGRPAPAGPSFSVNQACYSTCIDPNSQSDVCRSGSGTATWTCTTRTGNQVGAGAGALAQRPLNYVPFLTAKYDEQATAAKRKLGGPDVPAEHQWLYRPEMQFSVFSLKMKELNLKDSQSDTYRNLLATTEPSSSYGSDTLIRTLYQLDRPSSRALQDIDGEKRELGLALGKKFINVTFSPPKCPVEEPDCDLNQTTVIGAPGSTNSLSAQDYLALRLLQKGDEGNVLWQYAFQELWITFHDPHDTRITNLPIGEYTQARAVLEPKPKSAQDVRWSVVREETQRDVLISIDPTTGKIWVPPGSADGPAVIQAYINENLYRKVTVFVGCECKDCNVPGQCTKSARRVDFSFSLGESEGLSAGLLRVRRDSIDQAVYKRSALQLSVLDHRALESVGDKGGLRQIITPMTFVNIIDIENGYELQFFHPNPNGPGEPNPDTGEYAVPSGVANVVWRFNNPNPGQPDSPSPGQPEPPRRLRCTEIRGDVVRHHEYVQDTSAGSLSLTEADGLRVEQEIESTEDGDRIVDNVVGDGTRTASNVRRRYRKFPWGEELIKEVRDPSGAALTTTIEYYEDPDDVGSYRQVFSRVEADGSWVRYGYDDHRRITTEMRPWLASIADPSAALPSESRVFQYSYAPLDTQDMGNSGGGFDDPTQYGYERPRVVTERVAGKLVSLSYLSIRSNGSGGHIDIEERCPNVSSTFGDGSCLRTETHYRGGDPADPLLGRVDQVKHTDGRLDTYDYELGRWNGANFLRGDGKALRTTVTHGTVTRPDGVANKSTREVSIVDDLGHAVRDEHHISVGGSYVLASWTQRAYNADGHLTSTTNSTGQEQRSSWGCCAQNAETDASGVTSVYDRDGLERVRSSTRAGVTTRYEVDAEGRQLQSSRSGDGITLTSSREYDGAGRLISSIDESGLVTSYAYTLGGRITQVTHPGGVTEVTEQYPDGQTKSITGNGMVPQYYSYEVLPNGTRVTEIHRGRPDAPAFERTYSDMLGRMLRSEQPGFGGTLEVTTTSYNAKGQVERVDAPGVAATLFEYDELGNRSRSGLDVDGNGTLTLASMDRITDSETKFTAVDGAYWQETSQTIYPEDNSSTAKNAGVSRTRLTGMAGGLVSDQVSIDLNGNVTRSTVNITPSSATEVRTVDTPESNQDAVTIAINGRVTSSTSTTGLTTTYGYDGLGRRTSVTDPRTGASETHYDTHGRVDYVKDAAGNQTSFVYDPSTGRKIRETNALGKHSYFAYNASGQLTRTWGDVPYPVQYDYDAYGRRTQMSTYREDAGWSSPTWPEGAHGDPTRWHYEEATGLLLSKEDAASKAVTYTYGTAGRLATRTWARQKPGGGPLRASYAFHPATGELTRVDYNDDTPDVIHVYDRLGRQSRVTDAVGTRAFAYDPQTLQLQTETIDGLTPAILKRSYELATVKGRQVGMQLGENYAVGYGYDPNGRLQSVSWTANGQNDAATYSRIPNSQLLAGYATQSGFATAYTYEPKRDLKTQVQNKFGSAVVSQFDYAYDAIGRRTSMKNSGIAFAASAFTKWGYDERNQVTQSERYLGTNLTDLSQPVNAEQRAFAYDPIGNRQTSTSAVAQTNYAVNELNQYDLIGRASPTYDNDGNLLDDGTKVLAYNAENQLKSVTVPGMSVSTYDYDYIGRRVRKSVRVLYASGQDYVVTWAYSGWNRIEERRVESGITTVKNFVWALDVSQSIDGAGGVGGLLAIVDQSGAASQFTNDGNGNVSELISAPTGNVRAHYEFDAFGNTVFTSGAAALENCYRFSTKYQDDETGWYDYGHRYYAPSVGRWLSRDPIAENGGLNLYSFVGNRPTSAVDLTGLALYAFDGTGNDKDDPSRMPTHVAALYEMYTKEKWYMYGLGTRDYSTLGNLVGLGAALRIDQMWSLFEASYKAGDKEIDIIGFSRGAATAREFANRIYDKHPCAKIRFLGLFDTVAQIDTPDMYNSNYGVRLDIPPNVEYVAHAIARNERRTLFPLTSIVAAYGGYSYGVPNEYGPSDFRVSRGDRYWEQPFSGAHSDVGGGYDDGGSNLDALWWMYGVGASRGVPWDYSRFSPKQKMADYHAYETMHDSRYTILDRVPWTDVGRESRVIFSGNLKP